MTRDSIFIKEMGKRISMRRKQLNLTQEELAELADVSPQLLSTAERGTKALRPENLYKICRALEVSSDFILSGYTIIEPNTFIDTNNTNLSPSQMSIINNIVEECFHLLETNKSLEN